MSVSHVDIRGRKVSLIEAGEGRPLVYLHGFADVHGVSEDLLPFHTALAGQRRVIAPAHPGINGSDELGSCSSPGDVVFHYLELLDAMDLKTFDLVGHCVGGWIAAELAVIVPERVRTLSLIGASGLQVPGALIGDVFMHAQPERGVDYRSLRALMFASDTAGPALRYFPDGRGELEEDVRRYQMLRFSSFVGFRPPYFYNPALRERLHRARMPAVVVWGQHDRFVPLAHGEAYASGLPGAGGAISVVEGAGHAAAMEAADQTAAPILRLIG